MRVKLEMLRAFFPAASSMPFAVMRKTFCPAIEYQKSFSALRYQPDVGSFTQVMPGAATTPSVFLKGTSMPPDPERDSESESADAMSESVGFAQPSARISVWLTTGLPAGR